MNTLTETVSDAEYIILENIYKKQGEKAATTQRGLAGASGLSLGMTNALLKKMSEKGWVLLRRVNARNIQYVLTPSGMNEVARRASNYLKRVASAASLYREKIDEFVLSAKLRGVSRLVFVGMSDIDFLIAHSCERHGLLFIKTINEDRLEALEVSSFTFVVYADASLRSALSGKFNSVDLLSII